MDTVIQFDVFAMSSGCSVRATVLVFFLRIVGPNPKNKNFRTQSLKEQRDKHKRFLASADH